MLTPDDPKWWHVRSGLKEGYAAKYYFAMKNTMEGKEYEKEPWYFGGMTRAEAEDLLADTANPDGSFLVRWTTKGGGQNVLTLKYFNTKPREPQGYKYMNYNVKTEGNAVYFSKKKLCSQLPELINFCMDNKADGVATKLTNICLIPNPHADPTFQFHNTEHDSLRVPYSELVLGKELGSGQFGKVYAAKFRGNLEVAVKQLKVMNEEEGTKALEEFFKEIATMRALNHPNLVQLFAYVTDEKEGNFMIQEFMAQGDLKIYLQKLKKDQQRMNREPKLWSMLLAWNIEVARGMEQLEKLKLVHRDLAARFTLFFNLIPTCPQECTFG